MLSTITIGLSFGTPLVALLSGKLFVDIYRANRLIHIKAQEEYTQAMKQWDSVINGAWTKYQKETDNRRVSSAVDKQRTDVNDLSVYSTDRQTDNRRVSSAVDIALDYLKDNPDTANLTVRELGDLIGVGKDSAAKARKIFSENGHSD
jgi:hypothetical protein